MDYNKILYGEIKFVPHNITSVRNNIHNCNGTTAKKISTNNNGATNEFGGDKTALQISPSPNKTAALTIKGDSELASFRAPKYSLSDPNLVRLDWMHTEKIGGGLINVGNTCFLNSVLQCLTYCPPLYNYLVKYDGGHSNKCKLTQFCMLCEMEKHVRRIKSSNGTPIKPISIVQRLKFINKSFQFGRQEDAHELLRYLIDHMWKACLMNLDINVKNNGCGDKIDPRVKETTAINHIFGGYHRSQVLCLGCNSRSNTFDFFMDFILDIRNAKSLEDSLKKFTQPETLEHENAYKCSKCKKKVTARKRFSVFRAPNVATFQLKRFDSDRIFGGKVTKYVSYPEELDLRPYMSELTKSPIRYSLNAVLVHVGHSSNSGHYFCYIKNSNGFWYKMDDSSVIVVNKSIVLQQQAYILFYIKKSCDPSTTDNVPKSLKVPQTNELPRKNQSNGVYHNPVQSINNNNNSINDGTYDESTNEPLNPAASIITTTTEPTSPQKANNYITKRSVDAIDTTLQSNTKTCETNNNVDKAESNLMNLTTWSGTNSKLDDEDPGKRKLNSITERDKFNEELDQGKTKKIKSYNRDDRFNHLSKSNPFQRFNGSNGYQQSNDINTKSGNRNVFHGKNHDRQNGNDNSTKANNFHKHNHNQSKLNDFRRQNFNLNRPKFMNQHGKHKNRHSNRR